MEFLCLSVMVLAGRSSPFLGTGYTLGVSLLPSRLLHLVLNLHPESRRKTTDIIELVDQGEKVFEVGDVGDGHGRRYRGPARVALFETAQRGVGYESARWTPSTPRNRNSGCSVDSVHACSHGIQNIAATVWFRKVTMERECFPLGQGMST